MFLSRMIFKDFSVYRSLTLLKEVPESPEKVLQFYPRVKPEFDSTF